MSICNICPNFFSDITLKLQAPELETEGGGEEVGSIVIRFQLEDIVCGHLIYLYLDYMMNTSAVCQNCSSEICE
jgi:hypothetical protein